MKYTLLHILSHTHAYKNVGLHLHKHTTLVEVKRNVNSKPHGENKRTRHTEGRIRTVSHTYTHIQTGTSSRNVRQFHPFCLFLVYQKQAQEQTKGVYAPVTENFERKKTPVPEKSKQTQN